MGVIPKDWKNYSSQNLGISLYYPSNFTISKETPSEVIFSGNDTIKYLTISIDQSNFIDSKKYKGCDSFNDISPDQYPPPCLTEKESTTNIDDKKAMTFELSQGQDALYEIVQVPGANKKIQLKMFISGGGLSNTFEKIISTFKFIVR